MENITVIGVGKLGLGFALLLEKSHYNVLGVDISPQYVDQLNEKTAQFAEPQYNELLQQSTKFKATTDLQAGLDHSDLIFIIVQTPNGGGNKFYDHSILSNLLERINTLRPQNKHFIIGCTVMPHYIDQIATPLLSLSLNCSINYNPEFVAQGDIVQGFENPDMILVGTTVPSILTPIMTDIYTRMTNTQPIFSFMTPLEAEIVKISLNGFITTKISFANMISDFCDTIPNANKEVVLDAIGSDSRIGTKYFKPGTSFGGPCFPRDTKALKQLMDQNNITSDLLQATTKYNEEHVEFQVKQLLSEDPSTSCKMQMLLTCRSQYNGINHLGFTFTNVCYKEGSKIPIIEESAKLKIAERIVKNYNIPVTIRDVAPIINEVKKEYGNRRIVAKIYEIRSVT
jgi:nucleotide sugar dehydrogenase